ncbi:MAG TPA: hypothetical protein VKU01_14615 [Bryobacteraceae bacterium]|nr:hypothetical protein [Bryobacteraceae bacterium]
MRTRFLIALSALPLLIAATVEPNTDRVLFRQGFLEVVSPDGASAEQCRLAAKKAIAAWRFDMNLMKWGHPGEMERSLTLRLISDDRMRREHPGGRAYAEPSGDRFNVRMGLLDDPNLDLTLAHELGHIQAFRALGSQAKKPPTYFLEGHGLMMNQFYADFLGIDRGEGGHRQAKAMISITADEAEAILSDDRYHRVGPREERIAKEYRMECMGLYFVEYLRVRKGIPDAVPKMGRVFEWEGRGQGYEQAFARAYGLSLDEAFSEIVAFFRQTAAHPSERLKGTRFGDYLAPAR